MKNGANIEAKEIVRLPTSIIHSSVLIDLIVAQVYIFPVTESLIVNIHLKYLTDNIVIVCTWYCEILLYALIIATLLL